MHITFIIYKIDYRLIKDILVDETNTNVDLKSINKSVMLFPLTTDNNILGKPMKVVNLNGVNTNVPIIRNNTVVNLINTIKENTISKKINDSVVLDPKSVFYLRDSFKPEHILVVKHIDEN